MTARIPSGVWPTMITPYREDRSIDYETLGKLIDWYKSAKVSGLFAVCQSSEMFYLTLEERIALASFTMERVNGEIPVIASGHISDRIEDQIEEIGAITETGIDAFVLVTNRLANADESDEIWKNNAEKILAAFPDQTFGLYECPHPYKRLLSLPLLEWCASTGRFLFLKDTCCDLDMLAERLKVLAGTPLQLFNANSATLLQSLRMGAAGFSGVMANFHPELYVWLTNNGIASADLTDRAEQLQSFLGFASLAELQLYPINAKYHMQLEGVPFSLYSRSKDHEAFDQHARILMNQLRATAGWFKDNLING